MRSSRWPGKTPSISKLPRPRSKWICWAQIKQVNDKHLTEMNHTLHNIEKFLVRGASNSSASSRRWSGPATGLARVHQGEYVLSASQVRTLSSGASSTGPMTLNMAVTVNASGMDRQSLAQAGEPSAGKAWDWIENAAERRRHSAETRQVEETHSVPPLLLTFPVASPTVTITLRPAFVRLVNPQVTPLQMVHISQGGRMFTFSVGDPPILNRVLPLEIRSLHEANDGSFTGWEGVRVFVLQTLPE